MKYKSIIISGLPGSGKGKLSIELSKKFRWKIFSAGDLWRRKYNRKYPDKGRTFEEFWKSQSKKEQQKIDKKIRHAIEQGNIIGEFRYATICNGLSALLVFLNPSLDIRAERALKIKKYDVETLQKVKKILLQREQDELKIGRELHGQDYDFRNLDNYDLILDTGKLSIKEEVEKIAELLK